MQTHTHTHSCVHQASEHTTLAAIFNIYIHIENGRAGEGLRKSVSDGDRESAKLNNTRHEETENGKHLFIVCGDCKRQSGPPYVGAAENEFSFTQKKKVENEWGSEPAIQRTGE